MNDVEMRFESGLAQLALELRPRQVAKLIEFGELVLYRNQFTNLTGARTLDRFLTEQVLDSLSVLSVAELAGPLLDLGSGAGLPGIPLAIAHSATEMTLLEPRAKRAEFLALAASKLALGNTTVVKASAAGPSAASLRGKAGSVLVRAVAEPSEAIVLGAPFVASKGALVLYEGRAKKATRQQIETASREGLLPPKIFRVDVPGLGSARNIWIFGRAG